MSMSMSMSPGSCPRGVTWGAGGKKYPNMVIWHIKLKGSDELNKIQVKLSSYGQTGDLEVESKGQISLNFNNKVNFKNFYTTLCVCSHK